MTLVGKSSSFAGEFGKVKGRIDLGKHSNRKFLEIMTFFEKKMNS